MFVGEWVISIRTLRKMVHSMVHKHDKHGFKSVQTSKVTINHPCVPCVPEIAQDGWFIDFLRAVQAVERGTGKVEPLNQVLPCLADHTVGVTGNYKALSLMNDS